MTFVLELFAYRLGSARLARLGIEASSPLCTVGHCGPVAAGNLSDTEEQKKSLDKSLNDSSSACWRDSSETMPGASLNSLL